MGRFYDDKRQAPRQPHTKKSGIKKKLHNDEKRPIDWITGPYDSVTAERSMWVAVITQAMMDALSRSRKPEDQFSKFEATRWLTSNSAPFRNVCMLAGLDPDYVRTRAKKALASSTSWRAGAGEGKRYEERKAYRERIKAQSIPHGTPVPPPCIPPSLLATCENFIA